MDYTTLEYRCSGGILTLTLNRPDRLNAFTVAMAEELIDAFGRADADDAVRAVVVTGAGRTFCAGMDLASTGNAFGLDESLAPTLSDFQERFEEPEIVHGVRDLGGRVVLAIHACLKPVIAAINGPAVGIGATLTLPMDVRLAAEDARIGFVFGRLGIVPDGCSSWFLPRIVGLSQALEWCYCAEVFDAQEALRGGLVASVVPAAQLADAADRIARRFVDGHSAVATALTRQMLRRGLAMANPLDAHRIESLALHHVSQHDGKEGVAAFL